MNINGTRVNFGLQTSAIPGSPKSAGSVTLGDGSIVPAVTGADALFVTEAVIGNVASVFAIDITDNDASASTAFSAGTQQVETATAVGTITTAGNATVTVTAAGMTGSPKAISVAVLLDDTASEWAEKVRVALAADTDVTALFAVSGTTTAIVLTRLTNLGCAFANDATLNIALADDTSAGITEAAASVDTTAGVASTGTSLTGGATEDFEGVAVSPLATVQAVAIRCTSGAATFACGVAAEAGEIASGEYRLIANVAGIADFPDTITFTATAIQTAISITVAGIEA
jgi:hypothetical protein